MLKGLGKKGELTKPTFHVLLWFLIAVSVGVVMYVAVKKILGMMHI
ncbi:hypothetical protein KY320_03710 [Candidatus Woesearchaeota archaeon]|nr:hypothetical protein [Candidatus Woesearchaeota archaeon]